MASLQSRDGLFDRSELTRQQWLSRYELEEAADLTRRHQVDATSFLVDDLLPLEEGTKATRIHERHARRIDDDLSQTSFDQELELSFEQRGGCQVDLARDL